MACSGQKSRDSSMAPPPSTLSSGVPPLHPGIRDVTEDTPPDLLEGTMELMVILPSTSTVRMTVERRTPIMDFLIQVGTINKLNPGDHITKVRNQRGFDLPYKPSTPIGALDTTTVEIVPKHRVNDYIVVKKPPRVANQPFEHTFRLQVHLPRNQLYVMRVSMKTVLEEILKEVCQEKNLDIQKYEIRHPGNQDERLPLHGTLGEFGLHEITVVSKNTKISNSVSTADIIALQQTDVARGKSYLDSSFKHSRSSVGDSSVSSGSTGRGLSPTRSDDSRSVSPFCMQHSSGKLSHRPNSGSSSDVNHPVPATVHKSMSMSNMFSPAAVSGVAGGIRPPPRQKKRTAPLPPPLLKSLTISSMTITSALDENNDAARVTPKKKEAPKAPSLSKSSLTSSATQLNQSHHQSNHSRHSSGSSGYNDGGIFGLTQSELHRYDRQSSAPAMLSRQTTAKSVSNLTTTSSISNTSLTSSSGGSKKRKAPTPPSILPLKPQSEIDEEDFSESSNPRSVPIEVTGPPSKSSVRQNSVEVEVVVHHHHHSNHQRSEAESSKYASTPISVNTSKDEDQYSSTPASSLSSPGSYLSSSSTSSPLPPNIEPLTDPDSGNAMTSRHENSSGSSQAPAPLPPPRRSTKEVPLEPENEITVTQPQAKPRPKPRPDRNSSGDAPAVVHHLVSKPSISSESGDDKSEEPQAQPILLSAQLRNPLSKYGVKVLPDNVLKERADRLSKAASTTSGVEHGSESRGGRELRNGGSGSVSSRNKKTLAPPPPDSTTVKPPLPPSSKNSAFQLRKRESDSSSPSESSKQRHEQKSYKSVIPQRKKSINSSLDEDSDFLEENLELFEPVVQPSQPNLISLNSPRSSSSSTADGGHSQPKGHKSKAPSAPPSQSSKPQSKEACDMITAANSSILSSSASDFLLQKRKSGEKVESLNVGVKELVRTNSDRHNNKDNTETSNSSSVEDKDGKLLNRWQNVESLNDIITGSFDASNRNINNLGVKVEGAHNTSSTHFAKRSHPLPHKKLSSSDDFHEGKLHSVNDVDDVGHASSESEVSYTDSGVPTMELTTPSPMDFDERISDHDDEDGNNSPTKQKPSESGGSSSRSSFRSDEGDQWRDVLKEKSENSQKAQEKTFDAAFDASMQPQSLKDGEGTKDKTELNTQEPNDYQNDNELSSTDDDQNLAKQSSRRTSSESSSSRKLSKSESFSHNSEFEFIQMKRNKFADGKSHKIHNSTSDSRLSRHSSSEEDVRFSNMRQMNHNNEVANVHIKQPMHSSDHDGVRVLNNEAREPEPSHQKTASLYEIGNDKSVSDKPEAAKDYQSQLQEQFEQWKLDFLKKHVEPGTTSSNLNSPTQVEQDNRPVIKTSSRMDEDSALNNQDTVLSSSKDTVSIMESVHNDPQLSSVTYSELETTSPLNSNGQSERGASPNVNKNLQYKNLTPIQRVEYRYTGPPNINMGAWTERPRSTVSVKKDDDYIMGFGQKPTRSEVTPAKVSSYSSFTQSMTPSPKVTPQVISPSFRSVADAISPKTTTPHNNKGLSATLNARPVSSVDSVDSVSTIKSVLSTWKQRVESNEDQKSVSQGHPPEIDIYESESSNTFTRTSNQKLISANHDLNNDMAKTVHNDRKMQIVDMGANVNISLSKGTFDQEKKVVNENSAGISTSKKPSNILEQPIIKPQQDTPDSSRTKPMFKISSMESKPKLLSQIQSKELEASVQPSPTKTESAILRKSQVSLDISFPVENDSGPSLKERRRYFQGVSPVESPSKEMPVPAVNMKSSIANIQKVFEQRQQKQDFNSPSPSPTPTLHRSLTVTLPTKPEILVVESERKIISPSSAVPPSQSAPRQFQMMSSAEMVQRVLGKSSKPAFEAFRRSPSPISSTSSTLSRTSSGRNTPASASSDGMESSVRIANEIKKPIPNNIKNIGNKSVIIVQGQSPPEPIITDSTKPGAGSVSNNVFKLQNSMSISGIKKRPSSGEIPVKRNNSITTTTIVINGDSTPAEKFKDKFKDKRQSSNSVNSQIVAAPEIAQVSSSESRPARHSISIIEGVPPPPPPPLPNADMQINRPKNLSISGQQTSETFSSPTSNKSSTSSPNSDPRSEIFNVIKQSNGNFGLKKTGSTFLLK